MRLRVLLRKLALYCLLGGLGLQKVFALKNQELPQLVVFDTESPDNGRLSPDDLGRLIERIKYLQNERDLHEDR